MNSVNFKVELRARWDKGSDAAGYPIYLVNKFAGVKNPSFKATGIYVSSRAEWDKDHQLILKRSGIDPVIAEEERLLKQTELDSQRLAEFNYLLKQKITGKRVTKATAKKKIISNLFEYIKSVRGENEFSDQCINHVKAFHGGEPSIHDITPEWLRLFQTDYFEKKLKLKPNTILKSMKVLRRVTNQAVTEGYIDRPVLGRGGHKVPKTPKTQRIYLIQEERERLVKGLFEGKYDNNRQLKQSLTYFLLCCYTGLRRGDAKLFRIAQHVEGPLIKMTAQKTGADIVYRYTDTCRRLFALIESEVGVFKQGKDTYGANLKIIAKDFKINKNVTSHTGRHSFGRMMAEEKVSISDCAYFMGIDPKTCLIYYHLTGEIVNDRNMHLQKL